MIENVFTHKGWFYFIPVYLGNIDSYNNMVVAARYHLDFLFPLADALHAFDCFIRGDMDYPFKITGKL